MHPNLSPWSVIPNESSFGKIGHDEQGRLLETIITCKTCHIKCNVFITFYKFYATGYYRLAYTYVKNQQDALDIVQEAICKALESQHKLKNPDGIKSWFYKIVVHTALDFLRKSNKIVLTEDEILEDIGGSSSDNYEDTDLMSALDRLSDENKTIVVLRYFEVMKLQDIASIMNMPESTVKTKLYSSLKKLRIELE